MIPKNINRSITQSSHSLRIWAILCGLWVTGQLIVIFLFDRPWLLDRGADSSTYLKWARALPAIEGEQWSYAGFLFIVRFFDEIGIGLNGLLALNFIATMIAAKCLHSVARAEFGNVASWVAAGTYLLHPLVSQWFKYALTDALFAAGVIVVVWGCWRLQTKPSTHSWLGLVLIMVATASLRPNGLILVGAVFAYLLAGRSDSSWKRATKYAAVWLVIFCIGLVVPIFANEGGDSYSLVSRAASGEIVYGDSERALDMPDARIETGSNVEYIEYVIEHPIQNLQLFGAKVGWELGQLRPWYSSFLNLYLTAFMTSFYGLVILCITRCRRPDLLKLLLAVSLPFLVFIGMTWSIWEGRFAWWFLSVWLIPFGGGVQYVGQLLRRRMLK